MFPKARKYAKNGWKALQLMTFILSSRGICKYRKEEGWGECHSFTFEVYWGSLLVLETFSTYGQEDCAYVKPYADRHQYLIEIALLKHNNNGLLSDSACNI